MFSATKLTSEGVGCQDVVVVLGWSRVGCQIVVCLGMFAVLGSVCEPGSPCDQQSTVAPQSDIGLKSVVEDLKHLI